MFLAAFNHAESHNGPRRSAGLTVEEQRNLKTIYRDVKDYNAGRLSNVIDGYSPSYTWTTPFFDNRTLKGIEETSRGLAHVAQMFPNAYYDILANMARGSYTQTFFLMSGKRVDGFMGLPRVDSDYSLFIATVNKFDSEGRRLETREAWDRMQILQQVGTPAAMLESFLPKGSQKPEGGAMYPGVPPYRPGGGPWQAVEQRNYESVARGIVAFNARDAEASVADLSPESIWYSNALPAPIVGREPAAKWIAKSFEILPDTTFELVHMFAWRDSVQVLFRASGTKSLGFLGMPASNRPFQYFRSVLSRYDRNGRRAMVWDVWEEAQILRAQGFMPALPPFEPESSNAASPSSHPLTVPVAFGGDSHPLSRSEVSVPGGEITGGDLERLKQKVGPQAETEARTMLQRSANFDLVGRVIHIDRPGGRENRTQGIWEIDLLETQVGRSFLVSSGSLAGRVQLSWRILPSYFGPRVDPSTASAEEELPHPVELDGEITFADARRSRIRLRGQGLAKASTGFDFLLGATLKIGSGSGIFHRKKGLVTISVGGDHTQTARVVLKIHDPMSSLRSTSGRSKIGEPSLDSGDLVITLEGGEDPERPVQFEFGQDGNFIGALAHEKLYWADLDSGFHGTRLKARSRRLTAAGSSRFEVRFAASTAMPAGGISYTTQDAHLCFYDAAQREIGSLEADIVWGRAFPTEIPGIEVPAFRMGGLAPITRGHGLFQGARGWIAVNSLFSLVPQIISSVLTLHLAAPSRKLSQGLIQAWR